MKADDSISTSLPSEKPWFWAFLGLKSEYFSLKSGGVQKAKLDLCQNKINAQGVSRVSGSL